MNINWLLISKCLALMPQTIQVLICLTCYSSTEILYKLQCWLLTPESFLPVLSWFKHIIPIELFYTTHFWPHVSEGCNLTGSLYVSILDTMKQDILLDWKILTESKVVKAFWWKQLVLGKGLCFSAKRSFLVIFID